MKIETWKSDQNQEERHLFDDKGRYVAGVNPKLGHKDLASAMQALQNQSSGRSASLDRSRTAVAEYPNKAGRSPASDHIYRFPQRSSVYHQLHEQVVMCPPRYLSTRIKNNVWMSGEKIDTERACRQYERLKNVVEALGVTVLEIPPRKDCQDQTYVANIGIAIEPYIVLANYKAPGRACEVQPARAFFEELGYECIQPPYHFEGEADLKKWRDGVYFGGHGQFTDRRALDWIADRCKVDIIPLHEVNPKVYHLDCSVLVVDEDNLIVSKAGLDAESFGRLKKLAEVVEPPPEIFTTGITNAYLVREKEICLSGTFNPEMPDYRKAMQWMNCTFDRFGFTVLFMDVDEFDKSGADLSCCIMHLDF
jgi:N-dimethylarginine dimethylaminohydrolase